ncbi:GTPase [candidate division WOR-3 bacterium]|nr:GTPase [candidate division WOR-3 bacterium]
MRKKVIIMGAAGRDFHNFNVYFRSNQDYEVVAFTATQIPDIENRRYPTELAGKLYSRGIPIYPEAEIKNLIKKHDVDLITFAYSDVTHEYVMHRASLILSCGADYMLLGPKSTMLKSKKPVIAIGAIRTGCGKSQTTRRISKILKDLNKKVVIVRHPMPYGNLTHQVVQRFETYNDLKNCTIEEREEYESHIVQGTVVYAGVDYEKILCQAELEADIIIWDGGNNDFPFYEPNLFIVIVDPLRVGHELLYHPGETCLRMACVVVINKIDSAKPRDVKELRNTVHKVNPEATIIEAESPIFVDKPEIIKNKTVLVIEDGPTLTHGGMQYGAGVVAAKRFSAKKIIDPKPYAVGSIAEVYKKYPSIGSILPAMGYGSKQIKELELTIEKSPCESVIIATPIDLRKIVNFKKPNTRVTYELKEVGKPNLEEILVKWLNS